MKQTFTYLTIFGLLAAGISIVFFQYNTYISSNLHRVNTLGSRGDAFGGLNAFFSGIGIAGVVVAIIMQSLELRHQRQELKGNTNSLLLTSYLNALDSLRQCYAFDMPNERHRPNDEATPELSARLKYRLTLSKLEALVRHLEKNEKDLKQLEGASIARSEHWLITLKSTVQIFQGEWNREIARRSKTMNLHYVGGQTSERIGDVRFHEVQQSAVRLSNRLFDMLEELNSGPTLDQGKESFGKVSELLNTIEERERQAKAAKERSDGLLLIDVDQQIEFEHLWKPVRDALDEYTQCIESLLEDGKILSFRS